MDPSIRPDRPHRRRRVLATTAIVGLAVGVLAACGSRDDASGSGASGGGSAGGSSASNAKLTIGIKFDQPGLGLKEADGSFSGFDVETAKYVAKALGVSEDNITWKEAKSAERENLLATGQVDLIFATYSITDERKQKVDFAGPYFIAHQDLLVRQDDSSITGPDTLNGKKLCSVTGSTSAQKVKDTFAGEVQLQEYSKYSDCVNALVNGGIDALTTDDVILAGFAAQAQYKGKLKVVGEGFSDENYGVGIKKGDSEMVTKVNEALQEYIDDGSWEKALDSTVGPSGYTIPEPPSPGGS